MRFWFSFDKISTNFCLASSNKSDNNGNYETSPQMKMEKTFEQLLSIIRNIIMLTKTLRWLIQKKV